MTVDQLQVEEITKLVLAGRADAGHFIKCWGEYSRAVDNCVDDGKWDKDYLVNLFALGCKCYSTHFYRHHIQSLQGACLGATALWEQSVTWEKDPELWKRQWADVLRHADVLVAGAVAHICSGWDAVKHVTGIFLSAGYADHKERYGIPS